MNARRPPAHALATAVLAATAREAFTVAQVRPLLWALGTGAAVAVVTLIGIAAIPADWMSLGNLGTIWLVPAFWIGTRGQIARVSVVSGAFSLLAAVAAFYAITGGPAHMLPSYLTVWLLTAALAGAVSGLCGSVWRAKGLYQHWAGAFLPGVLVAEGANFLINRQNIYRTITAGTAEIVAGIAMMAVLLGWPHRGVSRHGSGRRRCIGRISDLSAGVAVRHDVGELPGAAPLCKNALCRRQHRE